MCEYLGDKPVVRNESEGCSAAEVGGRKPAPSTDHASLTKDSSLSIPVGTRKMVNYA